MHFSIIAAFLATTAVAAPATSLDPNAVETFSLPDDFDTANATSTSEGLLVRGGDCDYFIKTYKGKHCSGDVIEDGSKRNQDCYQFDRGDRGSFSIKPKASHCTHGHVQFFKSNSLNYCAGGVKFDSDFRGYTCMSPQDNHPYDSMIIRNY